MNAAKIHAPLQGAHPAHAPPSPLSGGGAWARGRIDPTLRDGQVSDAARGDEIFAWFEAFESLESPPRREGAVFYGVDRRNGASIVVDRESGGAVDVTF